MAASKKVEAYLVNPSVPREHKSKVIVEALDKAGACQTTKNAMATIADAGRMTDIKKVMSQFDELMVASRGELTAIVTTTEAPDAAAKKEIEAQVASFVEGTKSVSISYKVNPGLVSGITIEMGDKFVDLSAAKQLKKLTLLLGLNA